MIYWNKRLNCKGEYKEGMKKYEESINSCRHAE